MWISPKTSRNKFLYEKGLKLQDSTEGASVVVGLIIKALFTLIALLLSS
jgi:hypothetical protein